MEFDGYTIVRREIAHGGSGVVHDALSPNKHFSFKWHRLRTCIIIFLMTSIPLLFFIDDSAAMEIRNGQLVIPTAEITLIWEHYCMKHMRHNEWHLARLNKKTIEYQRNLDDFNTSQKVNGGKYEDTLCKILDKLELIRKASGDIAMIINSGYRNPYKNGQIAGSSRESMHIYGLAVDIAVQDFNEDGKTDKKDWKFLSDEIKRQGACVEPNDMAASWVHMDWRNVCPAGW